MKLTLKNIGKIREASVELNGITVIAGENNTGKSTVGRTLFSVFNSFYCIQDKIREERIESVGNIIEKLCFDTVNWLIQSDIAEGIAAQLIDNKDLEKDDTEKIGGEVIRLLTRMDEEFEEQMTEEEIDEYVLRIKDLLCVSDMDIFKNTLEKKLTAEFNGQINNIFSDTTGEIQLQIRGENLEIELQENHVSEIKNRVSLRTEAVYIDDPFVLDTIPKSSVFRNPFGQRLEAANHRAHLKEKLYGKKDTNLMEEIVVNNKIETIYEKIATVCGGDIVQRKRSGIGYRRKGSEKALDVKNLSTGLKTFVILKMLLQNGVIEHNGTLILDEPEIHLHPEWQLLFAELIVLIQKEFNLHVLLNTHSPYFLRAIQVYSAQYEAADKCKYYLAEVENEQAYITDVTENIEKIYQKLSRPLQKLEDVRCQDE